MYISVPIFLQCRTRWNCFEGGTLTDGIFFYLAVSPIVLKKDFITDRMPGTSVNWGSIYLAHVFSLS